MLIGKRIGPFSIERELGSGAMGTVYRATYHRDDGRQGPVALKVVSIGLLSNEGALARFERESAILKQLRHPHIVRLIATGHYQKTPFIAMEYVDGKALDRVLSERGRLGWEDVVTYGKHLCEALQHAHEKGIIHRDLKPSNLMLTKGGQLKLTDFGIAKDTDVTALTAQNNTIGTAAYMSPEQCQGKQLTARSDLYALGVVFYELLTGKKPFTAETTMDLFWKHVKEKAVRPAKLVPDLPVWLDNLVMFLLEKEVEQRPIDAATVGRMLADIQEKVTAGVSAGETVAKSRKVDRKLGDGPLDDADKAAAQAIRGKKKKRNRRPWYEAGWVRAVPLVVALVAMVGGITYLVWPEGMDARFARVEKAPPELRLEAAREFLDSYRKSADPRVEKVREVFRTEVAREKERILLKRLGGKLEANSEGFDPDLYPEAVAALKAERAGDLEAAARKWTAIQTKGSGDPARLPDDVEIVRGNLGWIAAVHLADIGTGVKTATASVREKLAEARTFEKPLPADGPEGSAVRGFLFEEYKDAPRAKKEWLATAEQFANDPDKRPWMLLAAQRAFAIGDGKDEPEARAKRLDEIVTERTAPLRADPTNTAAQRTARNTARELALLYDADPAEAVRAAVQRARAAADQTKGTGG